MAYGILCFSLVFTLVGTVFGGIWGNESWGRFWGWDPKENGALMIVLWQLVVLHARKAGWLSPWLLHFSNVLGGVIIAFAWWGVNMLGVGLAFLRLHIRAECPGHLLLVGSRALRPLHYPALPRPPAGGDEVIL